MRLRRLVALIACSGALASPLASSAAVDATTATLSNGLTVIIAPVHAAPAVTVGMLYKVGSRNETPWTTGVAHQVEHMMFKGTTDLLRPGDIDRRFIDNNATTDQDTTYYFESFQKDGLESALQVEADRMRNAAFDPAQLTSENLVVLAELDGSDNDPATVLDEQVEAAAMQAHQYHWPIIGWRSVVQTFAMRRDLVYDFYLRHYAPQNAVLVIAGDVDSGTALALVHRYFDTLPQRPVEPLEAIVEPAQHGVRRVNVLGHGSADRIELAYHVPGLYAADGYVLAVLDAVLASGQSSRLQRALVEGGYATDVTTATNPAVDPYVYTISATLKHDVAPDHARAVVDDELRGLGTTLVPPRELARAKKQLVAAHIFGHDGIEALAQALAAWQAWTGDWRNDERYAERINAVTADQVRFAERRYLIRENQTIGTYTVTSVARNGGKRTTHRTPQRAAPAPAGTLITSEASADQSSQPVRTVLPNGLVLIVQENHANASAYVEADIRRGSALDPPTKPGLASLTLAMLLRGTRGRSYDALQADLDALGIDVSAAVSHAGSRLSTQTLTGDEPKAMALLADVLMHPAFRIDEFSTAQEQLVAERRAARDDPEAVAREGLYRGLYPDTDAWSRPAEGTVRGLASVRIEDAKKFYGRHYRPNVTVIVVTGDVSAVAIREQVGRLFGAWQPARDPVVSASWFRPNPARSIVAEMPGESQVAVYAGAAGLQPNAPDRDAAQLMNFILGGRSFISKLLHQVRDVDGYVYGIGSAFSQSPTGGGPWTMSFGANPHDVNAAIKEAVAQMRVLQTGVLSDDELAQYRRLAVDDVITSELTNQGVADELLLDELLGRGLDYARRLPEIYAKITPAQIQAAAQTYLHPGDLVISTAGPRY